MMEQCKRTVAQRYLGMGHKYAVGPGYSGLLGKSVQSVNYYRKEYLVEYLDSSAMYFLTLLHNDVRNCHWSPK